MELKKCAIKSFWWTAHLNWQKMSAYSAEMLEACRTVTLKVKTLPILRCSSASSGASRLAFRGASTSSAPAGRNAEIQTKQFNVCIQGGQASRADHQYAWLFSGVMNHSLDSGHRGFYFGPVSALRTQTILSLTASLWQLGVPDIGRCLSTYTHTLTQTVNTFNHSH